MRTAEDTALEPTKDGKTQHRSLSFEGLESRELLAGLAIGVTLQDPVDFDVSVIESHGRSHQDVESVATVQDSGNFPIGVPLLDPIDELRPESRGSNAGLSQVANADLPMDHDWETLRDLVFAEGIPEVPPDSDAFWLSTTNELATQTNSALDLYFAGRNGENIPAVQVLYDGRDGKATGNGSPNTNGGNGQVARTETIDGRAFDAPRDIRPVANGQTLTTTEDTALAIVLTGDDWDSPPEQKLTYAIDQGPAHGKLTGFDPATGKGNYTPDANFHEVDRFTFTVTDDDTAGGPALTSTPATVEINVQPPNDRPGADGQTVTTAEDTGLAIVLTGGDGDLPQVQTLTYAIDQGPAHGKLTGFDAATGKVNHTPDVALFNASINENTDTSAAGVLIGSLSTTDADDGDSHTYTMVTGSGDSDNGSFTISGNQLKVNQNTELNHEAHDSYSVRVRSTDSGNMTTEKAYTVTDLDDETAVVGSKSATLDEGATLVLAATPLSASDDAALIFTVKSLPGQGTLKKDGTALAVNGFFAQADITADKINCIQNHCETTADSFTYTVRDGVPNETVFDTIDESESFDSLATTEDAYAHINAQSEVSVESRLRSRMSSECGSENPNVLQVFLGFIGTIGAFLTAMVLSAKKTSMSGDEIRKLRYRLSPTPEKGLSCQKFSELLGVTLATVNRWEKNESKPAEAMLERLLRLREFVETNAQLGSVIHRKDLLSFLKQGHNRLLNMAPIDLLNSDQGLEAILGELRALESGTFA